MAADVFEEQFTRVHNAVFRDSRMSFKAKGIFGLISTHRDGYGLSIESIVARSTDGAAAVRTGLNELENFGYLVRRQERLDGPTADQPNAKKGSFGQTEYFITDMPDGLTISLPSPAADQPQNPRSAPSFENRITEDASQNTRSEPSCDFPQTDEPRTGNPAHKKITSKNTISLSSRAGGRGRSERETATPKKHAVPAARTGASRAGEEELSNEAMDMIASLPGSPGRADALDLMPLVLDAAGAGWTLPALKAHLAKRCDPNRVYALGAVYRKLLKNLPDITETAPQVGAPSPNCPTCHGSGVAEDPETFLPAGPCGCRTAPALAS
ncbi:hypothetical protein [Streptomyces chartreusis]|uniref:Helix-turn-helix domain-containing protein n=1 Tax=Streptomyces chartreusis TaxID=1969 RepID=A0A7H8TBF7_STRCX|nr:hypothetical protein [Streptomyces chartreusis]QKZ20292.1 hypothetical protein HUT05_24830 [Streptomyces chartreusis]